MKRLLPALAAALALVAWHLLAILVAQPVLLPSPGDVIQAMGSHRAELSLAVGQTAMASIGGLALAGVFGVGGAVAFQRSRWVEAALYPYALLVQTLPIVAIAPLLVVWLGYGMPVALVAGAIAAFFPILTSTNLGLANASAERVELLRLYGASWWQELTLLRLPGALPQVFGGLRSAGGLAVIGAIVGEFVGSNGQPPSLGFLVLRSARAADTGLSFAAIGCAALLALAIFGVLRLLQWRVIGAWAARGG